MKLKEQATQQSVEVAQHNHICNLEMELDELKKTIEELESELGKIESDNDLLKEIIKSLAEVL